MKHTLSSENIETENMNKPEKILIIQLRRIGDVILTTPVIEMLRKNFPDARIDFLVEKPGAEILRGNPYLTRVHVYNTQKPLYWLKFIRSLRYDWVLDFLGNPRTAVLTLLSGADVKAGFEFPLRGLVYNHRAGIKSGKRSVIEFKLDLLRYVGLSVHYTGPSMFLSEHEKQFALKFFHDNNIRHNGVLIGIAPAHRRTVRQWRPEYYARLCDFLIQKHDVKVILFWGPGEEDVVQRIKQEMKHEPLIPSLISLREMAALIERCAMVIANCNGPKHMAEALRVPTLTIYGPTDPASWEAGNVLQSFVRADNLECIGCNQNECDKDLLCMHSVTPEMVEKEFTRLKKTMGTKIGVCPPNER